MATATKAPQTDSDVEAAPVVDGVNIDEAARAAQAAEDLAEFMKANAPGVRKAKREVAGYPVGSCVVIRDRGYNPELEERIFEGKDWVPVTVRERQDVTINGLRMVAEGPRNDEAYEMVTLPRPVANVLKNQRAMERSARDEWKKGTARDLGGSKETEQR